ncbi:MAG: hypothetical protein Q8R78_01420, partial [Candidatus Omnitrophota bacterium]|nr:hypothetical protein [Candidatus Omnitrophota bacterium]
MMAVLALDGSGNPVASYLGDDANVSILHCNDANCAPGGDSIKDPDIAGDVGRYSSLVLDALGYPVVSYYDAAIANKNLKLLHCNDVNCDSLVNGAESIQSPDTADDVGTETSLALDA